MSIGRLLTPTVSVTWGSLDLSAWDYGETLKRPVVYDVEVNFKAGDEKTNDASFLFDPSPVGFGAYTQCTDEDHLKEPITITFGYQNGSFIEAVFYFQDVDFVTGSDQSIRVNLSGLHKSALTSSWWTEYIGDGTKEFTVKELWDNVTKKLGYEVVWADDALKKMEDLPKITRAALVKETVGSWLLNTSKKYGFYLEWPTSSADDHKKILVKIGAADSASNETLAVQETAGSDGQKKKMGSERVSERLAFILGPTLVGSVSRKTRPLKASSKSYADAAHAIRRGGGQDTSVGQRYVGSDRGDANPGPVGQIPQEKLSGDEGTALDALLKRARQSQEYIEKEKEKVKNAALLAGNTAVEEEISSQAQERPPGAALPTDKSTENCVDKKTGKKLEGEKRQKCEKKIQDAKLKKELSELSECSCEIFMVPYMVGIQPKDFIVFPSLSYENPYIEDWEVSSVGYRQQGAAVVLSISGQRPKPGADNMIVEADMKKLQDRVTSMLTLRDWENMYWNTK